MGDSRWGLGYITDAHYAETYFRELSPAWMNYVSALHGIRGPSLDRPFTYLELGCGLGQSTIVHAAAFPDSAFYGCDFNTAHIASAIEHARACDVSNVTFTDAPFERLPLQRFPATFDYVALHGVYSWVDAADRQTIRRVLGERLRPGGLAYVSYNCLPGWTAEVPLRRLMRELAVGASGDTAERTRTAIQQLREFAEIPLRFFKVHPEASAAVESYSRGHHDYIAHEFLNEAWEPFYSIDVADDMESVGLQYVGSATLPDNHPVLVMDDGAARACAALPSARLQELALDFATSRRFRRDVFVKPEREATIPDPPYLDTVVGSLEDPATLDAKARVPRGDIRFQQTFIEDVRTHLAGGASTIGDMLAVLGRRTSDRSEVVRNIALLVAAGTLAPFARRHAPRHAGEQRSMAVATRILGQIAADGQPRAVPGHALGYGLMTTQPDARSAVDWLDASHTANENGRRVVQRLQRIGALVRESG